MKMAKTKMPGTSKSTGRRITFDEAVRLYPDQWVVFAEPRLDMTTGRFIDGVVFSHNKDEERALRTAKKLRTAGGGGIFYTGDPHYRKVTIRLDERSKAAA